MPRSNNPDTRGRPSRNEDPTAKALRLAAMGPDAKESFAERMRAQYANPDGPTHGGPRPNSGGDRTPAARMKVAEEWGVLPKNWMRLEELRQLYPNLTEYIEIDLDERRILAFMQILITTRSAAVMWRSTVERHCKAMGIGYDRALPLFREAKARLEGGTVAQVHAQLFQVAQHVMALALELVRRDGCTPDAVRELRETLKMVAGMAGLGPKLAIEFPKTGPAPGQSRVEYLGGMLAKLEGAVSQVRAEIDVERDSAAIEVGALAP